MTKYKLPDDLYEYQKEDVDKMSNGGNFLNFSEMGVGKTPEALGVCQKEGYKHVLILCPSSLKWEWKRQIDDWVGEDLTAVCTQDAYMFKLKPIVYGVTKEGKKYCVVNYETLRSKDNLELLSIIPFDIIIMDEVHKLRNSKTKQVKGAREFIKLLSNSKVIAMSGSPIMNYPNDLYVPLSLVDPKRFPPTRQEEDMFQRRYCLYAPGQYGWYVYGTQRMDELKELTKPYLIRRLKKDVLSYLPEKYYRRILVDMPSDQRKLYDQMEEELRILLDSGEPLYSRSVLAKLTRLRQINLDPKVLGVTSESAKTDLIFELMSDTDENMVVFSCFEKYIELLSLLCQSQGVKHVVITGLVPTQERIERVKRFQNDPSIKLCLGTVQTMGEGITLTAANNVVLVDRWWNEPTNQQAIDRLHRIGQHNPVQVILPICRDSVDETLDEILQRKDKLSDSFFQESRVTQLVVEDRTSKGGIISAKA